MGSTDDNWRQRRQKQWWRTTPNGEEGSEFSMEQICNKIKKNGKILVTSLPKWCFFFLYSLCSRYSLDGISA